MVVVGAEQLPALAAGEVFVYARGAYRSFKLSQFYFLELSMSDSSFIDLLLPCLGGPCRNLCDALRVENYTISDVDVESGLDLFATRCGPVYHSARHIVSHRFSA